ncbi:MAG: DUF1294 domain-containing protein [Nannocystaceae bacterium]
MPETADPALVALAGMYLWWIVAAIGGVLQSSREAGGKALWVLALVLFSPIAVVAYFFFGRDPARRRGLGVTGYLSIATIGAAVLLAATREVWKGHEHLAWIVAWGAVTFVMYAIDKSASAAGKDDRGNSKEARVNELALHLLALLGGFVGGWIGRHGLRHKTNKPVFALVLLVATGLHVSKMLALW